MAQNLLLDLSSHHSRGHGLGDVPFSPAGAREDIVKNLQRHKHVFTKGDRKREKEKEEREFVHALAG